MSPNGDLKSFAATLTGPNPAFEVDVDVELAPFSGPGDKGPEQITFGTPTVWLDAGSLWASGVSPSVKGALEAAKSATGGRAVVLQGRKLAADQGKKEGA